MYTNEKNTQILIALLKEHGIRRVIANPGTANMSFVGSIQDDPWFDVYSGVDERHSAYMAVGMAAEKLEPVVLTCTGATASRNYLPALTEAYYRKLPVLAVTSTQEFVWQGQLHDQVLDRSSPPRDAVRLSVTCPLVKDDQTFRFCEREMNRAILELSRRGGGPVHINLETRYPLVFNVTALPVVRKITRINHLSETWPVLPRGKIVIWIGAHARFPRETIIIIEEFVRRHNAVVLVSKQSSYGGYGNVSAELLAASGRCNRLEMKPDLIIHIGEITAAHCTNAYLDHKAPVWRVSEDGEIRDLLGTCEHVFEMTDGEFFAHYVSKNCVTNNYAEMWADVEDECRRGLPDLPFSNYWIAQKSYGLIPQNSILHLGILSSVRAWNFCPTIHNVDSFCNSGGFGIDGNVSSMIGSSLVSKNKLHFCIVGDLSFFYDLNAIGNRHVGKNVRIMVINNGEGLEFSLFCNPGACFGTRTRDYIGAGGHFGKRSHNLLKHYATDLGFEYLTASTKEEYLKNVERFLTINAEKPMLFECFVAPEDDKEAFRLLLQSSPSPTSVTKRIRSFVASCLPSPVKKTIKNILQ